MEKIGCRDRGLLLVIWSSLSPTPVELGVFCKNLRAAHKLIYNEFVEKVLLSSYKCRHVGVSVLRSLFFYFFFKLASHTSMMDGTLHGAWDLPPSGRDVILCADGILQWKPPTAALPLGRHELFHLMGRKLIAPCRLLGVKRAINDKRPLEEEGEFILKQN